MVSHGGTRAPANRRTGFAVPIDRRNARSEFGDKNIRGIIAANKSLRRLQSMSIPYLRPHGRKQELKYPELAQ